MIDVEPMFKDNVGACGCGCGKEGTFRARKWRDGTLCVRRVCVCKRCLGSRNTKKGDSKARAARKALAIPGANTRHEEYLGGLVRWEAKAGAQVRPAWTAFLKAENQSEQQRPFGDHRPLIVTLGADGTSDQLVVFRLSNLAATVAALHEQLEEAS